jgi:serine acetyltransferase
VIIGARTNVTKDVPDYAFVAGNPAVIKRYRFTADQTQKLEEIAWWDWEEEKIKEAMPYMWDINKFIEKYS